MTLTWALVAAALALAPGPSLARNRAIALAHRAGLPSAQRVASDPAGSAPARVVAVALAACALAVSVLTGPALGAAFALAAATGGYLAGRAARARADQRRTQSLLAATRLIVAEFEAGGSPSAAFTAAAAASPEHRAQLLAAAEACRRGDQAPVGEGDLAPLAHAWQLAVVTGAPVASAIGRVADDLAARLDHRRTIAVAVSGAQASALMLAALPVLGVVLGIAMGAHPIDVLFGTATGRALCLLGVALDCAGVLWTARLTSRAGRV